MIIRRALLTKWSHFSWRGRKIRTGFCESVSIDLFPAAYVETIFSPELLSIINPNNYLVITAQICAGHQMEKDSRVPMKMGDFSVTDSEFNNIRER